MSTVLRLARAGSKKKPVYHVVAADSRRARDGRYIESLGLYKPTQDPIELKLNLERVNHWISVGATPSDTVQGLIKKWSAQQAEVSATENS